MLLLFRCCDLDFGPMTLKLNPDLDILKMCIQTENEVARSSHSKHIARILKKYGNISRGQSLISPTSNHIQRSSRDVFLPSYNRLLTSSFQDFLWTDTQTDATKNKTCSQHARGWLVWPEEGVFHWACLSRWWAVDAHMSPSGCETAAHVIDNIPLWNVSVNQWVQSWKILI